MKLLSGEIRLSASDLSNHLSCAHITPSDLSVARGERREPEYHSPDAVVLAERGMMHERAYLDHLGALGLRVVELPPGGDSAGATLDAMREGADVIAQAVLSAGEWFGRADVLRRVERPSALGEWRYEVYDCKLARETKAATILQLSLYCDLLAGIQGVLPEWTYVVTPGRGFEPEAHRVLDYAAYYRHVKARLLGAIGPGAVRSQPEPNPHCEVCRWFRECDAQWRRDDHLSLVAGITRLQRNQLEAWDVRTLAQLAGLPLPLAQRPDYGSAESYERVREQARVQFEGRSERRPVHEMLDVVRGAGLCLLPEPSPGDIFFDLEGDPFIDDGGREYLFGFVAEQEGELRYQYRWAMTAEEEKRAFQWFIDFAMARWPAYPGMHIYHYAAYEPSALKRLMGRYATREDEVDRMLRGDLLVDLRTVTKQALRASVEEYSLKTLEGFHGFTRAVPLDDARTARHQMEHALELSRPGSEDERIRATIAGYNDDDCRSTASLRDWLERERTALQRGGQFVPRPSAADAAPPPEVDARQQRVAGMIERLTAGIPADAAGRTGEQAARWLLANLLDWHRRESKYEWWEFFRLQDCTDDDLLEERCGLGGLRPMYRVRYEDRSVVYRYEFPRQETSIRGGEKLKHGKDSAGTAVEVDFGKRTLDIKRDKKFEERHPSAVFADPSPIKTEVQADSLLYLAESVLADGLDVPGAARDLLLRRPPRRVDDNGPLVRDGESTLDAAKRLALSLDRSLLAIQGPPGAGKTYTGARMIVELARSGKKIGVTANSHKVIRKLLQDVLAEAPIPIVQKAKEDDVDEDARGITLAGSNDEALAALQGAAPIVVAGTSWMWSREDFRDSVDVLFVDEAGQMSLANVLAMTSCCRSLVLLGDPQQLEQPQKGSHPDGADASALEHILGGAKTMPAEQGLFLDRTWRLHPDICAFTSELFYESRLQSHEGLERQRIEGLPWLDRAGLWFVPVAHTGNQNASPEEVERIASLVGELLQPGVTWVDSREQRRALTIDDILMIAPYNAQVSDLAARIRGRVGTVDKFQGQEAPVVIYSLTTSSPEEAPRGMEFLYSLNRLNVATSRGRAAVIVVGSPRLLEPECRSVRQIQLANALCRFAELAARPDALTAAV